MALALNSAFSGKFVSVAAIFSISLSFVALSSLDLKVLVWDEEAFSSIFSDIDHSNNSTRAAITIASQ